MNVIIIHGSYGSPNENWFPWLKTELEKFGHSVFVPNFPTPKGQSLENWMKTFKEFRQYLDKDTVLVGHSLGPAFILNVLEKLDKQVKAAFFAAGFVGNLGNPEFDEINKSFADKEFNWNKIKENCPLFSVFQSDNDPYVPMEKAEGLAGYLGVEPIIVREADHFNEKAGYLKFPEILEKIKEI